MLAIRLQRIGRKGYPVYRVAVQEAQRHPSSGRVVMYLGSYNPHTKEATINAEKAALYLKNGAQPTSRVVRLLEEAKIELPAWVKKSTPKSKKLRNPEKLRKKPKEEASAEEPAKEAEATETEEEK
jgi:small subunit ribosomal protein S16